MPVGAHGFVGRRLTEARTARGILTKSSLAELLDLSNNAISLYENCLLPDKKSNNPRPKTVANIAKLLKVKEAYFFQPIMERSFPFFWRSAHNATKHARSIWQAKFSWLKMIDSYLKSFLEMPSLNLPVLEALGVHKEVEYLNETEIEAITLKLRQFWGLGEAPISNMATLLENNGIMLSYGKLESEKLDAFSNKSEHDCSLHIFLGTDKRSGLRSRFDAAHELGHLVLHSHLTQKQFFSKKHSLYEKQAHRFASAFLMPKQSFMNDVWRTSIEALKSLRKRWLVSVGAMIHRCEDLGLYGNTDTKRIWSKYKRNWKTIEDDNHAFERPKLFKRSIDLIISESLRTKSEILQDLPFYQIDIEKLLNLPQGYLDDNFGETIPFPTIKNKHRPKEKAQNGKVIEHDFS